MRIDRYLFAEWLKIFSLAVAAILGLLLLSEIYNELPGFLKREASWEQTVAFFLLLVPGYLPSLLPVCFLLSLLFTLAVHQRNGEIVAIRSAGVSLFRLSRAFWWSGGLLALLLFWLNASLAPESVENARLIKERVKERELDRRADVIRGTLEDLAVYLPSGDEIWFVEVYRRSTGELFGVSVTLPGEESRIRHEAARARYDAAGGRWLLENGISLAVPSGEALPETLDSFESLELKASAMTPAVFLGLSQPPRDLTFRQLDALLDDLGGDPRTRPYRTRYLGILAAPLQFFVVVLIALPCALGSGRSRGSGGFFRAVWIYLLFFGVSALFALAGQRGWLPPLAAVWTPFALAAAAGAWMYRRNA